MELSCSYLYIVLSLIVTFQILSFCNYTVNLIHPMSGTIRCKFTSSHNCSFSMRSHGTFLGRNEFVNCFLCCVFIVIGYVYGDLEFRINICSFFYMSLLGFLVGFHCKGKNVFQKSNSRFVICCGNCQNVWNYILIVYTF